MPAFLFEGCLKIRQIGDLTAANLSAGWWGLHRVGSFSSAGEPLDPSTDRRKGAGFMPLTRGETVG